MKYQKIKFEKCFTRWSEFQKKLNDAMDDVANFPCDEDENLRGLFFKRLNGEGEFTCIFAIDKNKDVGIITYSEYHQHIDINDLYINEEYRCNKIGEKLITKVKKILNGRVLYVGTVGGNERALKFYEKMGFKILSYNLQLNGD